MFYLLSSWQTDFSNFIIGPTKLHHNTSSTEKVATMNKISAVDSRPHELRNVGHEPSFFLLTKRTPMERNNFLLPSAGNKLKVIRKNPNTPPLFIYKLPSARELLSLQGQINHLTRNSI